MIIVILPVISLTRGIIFGKVASQTTIMNWLAIHEKFYKNWQLLAVFILAMIFFVVTSGFISLMNEDGLIKWLSPDENANYYFTKLYAEHDTLIAFDKDNKAVQEIIHPRSFRSDLGELKPVSFLGIILIYGSLAKLFGIQIIPYLTPMFASFGIIFYYLLIKQIFDKKIALLSAVLLSFFPVYIYYTARSMFHNILFTVFFIIGLYFLVKIVSKKKIGDDKVYLKEFILNFFKYKKGDLHGLMMSALSGLFFGLAVLTRTSEMLWLLPALFLLWIFNFKRVKLEEILIFIAFFIVGYLPAFYYNQILYGSIWQGGYGEMNKSIADITDASSRLVKFSFLNKEQIIASFQVILSNIFYFGFRALESWQQFINYFMVMFYWIFWPAVFGLSYLIESWKEISNGKKKYLIVYLIISAILMFYYGSWEFNDNPDLTKITIGNSYTRYWLPIYLGAIPLTCLFVLRLAKIIIAKKENSFAYIDKQRIYEYNNPFASSLKTLESKNNIQEGFRKTCQWLKSNFTFRKNNYLEYYSNYLIVVFIGIICFISIQYVLIGSEEGLVESYYKHISAKEEIKKVFQLTPADSIVITEYHDKILFPERRVIVGLFNDDNMIVNYAKLAQKIPVYYFNFTFGEKDLEYLNNRRLDKFGLSLSKIENINAFSLYKVKVSQKSIDK